MSNITIATICLAIYGVCVVACGIILLITELPKRRKLDEVVEKLEDLENTVGCPRFYGERYVSVRWLLEYIEGR